MTALKLITPPPFAPLTLTEIKEYMRVTHPDEDSTIARCFSAALAYADGPDGFLQRALIDQTWQLTLDSFPGTGSSTWSTWSGGGMEIRIPLPPLIQIVNIFYDDPGGIQQILDPGRYSVDNVSEPGWIVPVGNWPSTFNGINAVRIRFRAGYVDAAQSPNIGAVPDGIIQALLIYAISTYDERGVAVYGERVGTAPWSAEQLLRRWRVEVPLA